MEEKTFFDSNGVSVSNARFIMHGREMQMQCMPKERNTTKRRAPLWQFEQLGTLRRKIIQRAGRLTWPQGELTLTMTANPAVKSAPLHYLKRLARAA